MTQETTLAGPPPRPALTLTEEELLVLTHGDLGVVPARIELPEDQQQADLALSVATRSLMARGLVVPDAPGDGQFDPASPGTEWTSPTAEHADAGPWVATEPLGLTLCLREIASCVLALQRVLGPHPGGTTEPTVATRYLHLHPQIAVLEDVTDQGMHSLLTVGSEHWEQAVADFIVPPDAQPGRGEVRVLGSEEGAVGELLADLGHPTVLVEVALMLPDGVRSSMIALGPGGTFVSHDSQTYHPAGPRELIAELLQQAEAELSVESATMGE